MRHLLARLVPSCPAMAGGGADFGAPPGVDSPGYRFVFQIEQYLSVDRRNQIERLVVGHDAGLHLVHHVGEGDAVLRVGEREAAS